MKTLGCLGSLWIGALVVCAVAPGACADGGAGCKGTAAEQRLIEALPAGNYRVLRSAPVDGSSLCAVVFEFMPEQAPPRRLVGYVDGENVFVGTHFRQGQNRSEELLAGLIAQRLNNERILMEDSVAMVYPRHSDAGGEDIYMVTDIQCPHCRLGAKLVKELADGNPGVRVKFLFTSMHGQQGVDHAARFLCQGGDALRYLAGDVAVDDGAAPCEKGLSKVELGMHFAQRVGIVATPTFIVGETVVVGADMEALDRAFSKVVAAVVRN